MKTIIDNLAAQTSFMGLGAFGFAVIIGGIGMTAAASFVKSDRYSAQLRAPVCELRMTDMNGDLRVLARGNPGETCPEMVERLKLKMSGLPAEYRALWFERLQGE